MGLTVIVAIVAVTCVCILSFVLLYTRRRWLTRQGDLFGCAHRMRDGGPGVDWAFGFARCHGDQLDWCRAFSLTLWPSRSFSRAGTSWQRRRVATALKETVLSDNSWIVTTEDRFTRHEHNLTMGLENVLGLMAWLELTPPGNRYLPDNADSSL